MVGQVAEVVVSTSQGLCQLSRHMCNMCREINTGQLGVLYIFISTSGLPSGQCFPGLVSSSMGARRGPYATGHVLVAFVGFLSLPPSVMPSGHIRMKFSIDRSIQRSEYFGCSNITSLPLAIWSQAHSTAKWMSRRCSARARRRA